MLMDGKWWLGAKIWKAIFADRKQNNCMRQQNACKYMCLLKTRCWQNIYWNQSCFADWRNTSKQPFHILSLQFTQAFISRTENRPLCIFVCVFHPTKIFLVDIFYSIQANWGITLKLWINWMNLKMFKIGHMCFNCMSWAAKIHELDSLIICQVNMKPNGTRATLLA